MSAAGGAAATLPSTRSGVVGDVDSELFRIYVYKVVPCAKKFGHDWSECPFAHDGEKATRRCASLYRYSSIVCPEVRQSKPCPRGDVCPYSHSIFEYWMHPARFRTQLCSFGTNCNRRICFFAHTQEQLRAPSEPVVGEALATRAPYLQGRAMPESRYALFPEQVPSLGAMAGQMHVMAPGGAQLLAQQELGGSVQLQQVVYVPAAGGGVGGVQAVPLGGPGGAVGGLQQWAAAAPPGSGMVYVPAGGMGAGAGASGYYPAGGPGGEYSAPMMLAAAPMQLMGGGAGAAAGGGGGGYGGAPMQLVVPADGSGGAAQGAYQVAPGGPVAYAPVVYASGGVVPVHPWGGQMLAQQQEQQHHQHPHHQQQQQQQALHLVPEGGEGGPPGPGGGRDRQRQDGPFLLTAGAALGGAAGQAVAGAGALQAGSAPQGVGGHPGGARQPGEAPGVDDVAQQMAGWRIQ